MDRSTALRPRSNIVYPTKKISKSEFRNIVNRIEGKRGILRQAVGGEKMSAILDCMAVQDILKKLRI